MGLAEICGGLKTFMNPASKMQTSLPCCFSGGNHPRLGLPSFHSGALSVSAFALLKLRRAGCRVGSPEGGHVEEAS